MEACNVMEARLSQYMMMTNITELVISTTFNSADSDITTGIYLSSSVVYPIQRFNSFLLWHSTTIILNIPNQPNYVAWTRFYLFT